MAGSFSQQLEDLLNPLPKFADPEDDADEATRARVIESLDGEDEDGGVGLGPGALRKHNTTLLSDTDRRYEGKTVSRKQLLMDLEGSEEDEDDDDDDVVIVEDEKEGGKDDEEDFVEDDASDIEINLEEEDDDEEETEGAKLVSKMEDGVVTPQRVDFHKLTEGMDDLGVSEDEDGEESEGSDEDEDGEESEGSDEDEDGEESEGSDEDEDGEESEGSNEDEEGGGIHTFSQARVHAEVEKGKAVQNQLALWDQLLEARIKIQKVLLTANQLPQPQTLPEFRRRGGPEVAAGLRDSHKALKALQRSLLELHDQLLHRTADTRSMVAGATPPRGGDEEMSGEEEGPPAKRKLDMAEYPDFMAKRFAAFEPYRNATLQKWHDKTRLAGGARSRGGFAAFDRSVLTQVEQVLADRERLLRRTQTRRSEYAVLGKAEAAGASGGVLPEGGGTEQQLKANAHLTDLDEDIFDDDDFYHQLLRELIDRRTSAADPNDQVAMGRQWLAIQKLRSKIKKKVDTKASKGRRVRFQVHSKLVNFMAPVDHGGMSEEARSELYRGLFGRTASVREAC